jgi:diguanylate cyclase (GGDEF)-like protein
MIINDDSGEAKEFSEALRNAKMLTQTISSPLNVLQPLEDFAPDLILLDYYMPRCSGSELARVIRQQEAYISIPIVFMAADSDQEKQIKALESGGDDFLIKKIPPAQLIAFIEARITRSRLLRSLMTRDGLTGLLNHTKTKEQLDLEIARARRRSGSLVLAMIDIDHFKLVNDTYGHPTGDRVLKSLARILQQRLRRTDIVGRYGGEEFVAILLDTEEKNAYRVLDEIREGFSQVEHQSEDKEFRVTFSCGLASFPSFEDATSISDAADKALYEAKRGGRNRIVLAEQYLF